jgi:hypothetical protein
LGLIIILISYFRYIFSLISILIPYFEPDNLEFEKNLGWPQNFSTFFRFFFSSKIIFWKNIFSNYFFIFFSLKLSNINLSTSFAKVKLLNFFLKNIMRIFCQRKTLELFCKQKKTTTRELYLSQNPKQLITLVVLCCNILCYLFVRIFHPFNFITTFCLCCSYMF